MNNPKDIPFAAAYVFTLLHLIRFLKQLPRPGSKTIVMLIIGIAAAINVRVGGILLIAYFGLFTGLAYLIKPSLRVKLSDFKHLGKITAIGLIVIVFAFFGGLLYWPYALQDPLSNPFKALSEMSNFSTSIRMLFEGAHLWSDELPWYYIPKWIAISAPLFSLFGLLFFAIFYVLKLKKTDYLPLMFILFTAIFPVAYAVFKGSSLYDGMRHFLFIYPILAVLAAWGWNEFIVLKKMKWIGSGILVILMALPTFWMIKNHPFQYTYFNEIFGGTAKAYGNYETDYWMNSIKNMSDWLIENDERIKNGDTIVVHTNCYIPANHYLRKRYPNAKVGYTRYNERGNKDGDYFMFISRFVNNDLMKSGAWPPAEVIYEEKAGGAVLGAISKRGSGMYDLQASKAEEAKDLGKAIEFYIKETQQNPKNETAWLGLANNYMQQRNFPKAKEAIDAFQKLSDTHINGLMALALYYLNTGDTANAKTTLEKMTKVNYKYNASYFYLTSIYARENQPLKAIAAVEKYDEVGGNAVQIYDTGIQLAQQLNKRAQELYFKAKKAYFQQNGSEAFSLLKQALAVDPDYEPAVKLNKAFEEIIAKQNEK
jgi:tetratricopeptide (TPR) repeat protein